MILNTGESRINPSSNKVVAVTGIIEHDSISTALVVRNTSLLHHETLSSSIEIKDMTPGDVRQGGSLLLQAGPAKTFVDRVRDVMTIVNLLFSSTWKMDASSERMFTTRFTIFIIRRCHIQLEARIANGHRLWGEDPLEIIQTWYHKRNGVQLPPKRFSFPTSFSAVLQMHGIIPDEDSTNENYWYTISGDNAQLWVNLLVGFIASMKSNLDALRKAGPAATTSNPAVTALYTVTRHLHSVVHTGILQHIITPDLSLKLEEAYKEHHGRRKSDPSLMGLMAGTPVAGMKSEGAEGDGEAEDEDEYDEEEEEDDGVLGLENASRRYLKTLTAGYAAANYLVQRGHRLSINTPRITTHLVSVQPISPSITVASIEDFTTRFLQHFKFGDKRNKIFAALTELGGRLAQKTFDGVVHAEAVVMGLAYSSQCTVDSELHAKLQSIASIFQGSEIPIGISKKCCFCCDLLASLIRRDDVGGGHLEFLIQGTHATIFPWIAPPGIPVGVLEEMRVELLKVLHDSISHAIKEMHSLQSTPTFYVREFDDGGTSGDDFAEEQLRQWIRGLEEGELEARNEQS